MALLPAPVGPVISTFELARATWATRLMTGFIEVDTLSIRALFGAASTCCRRATFSSCSRFTRAA